MKTFLRIYQEFIEFAGYKKFVLLIFFVIFFSAFVLIEPFFIAKTVQFLEEYQQTGIFIFSDFLWFLALWFGFIVLSSLLNFFHRYYISDKTSLEFHNFVAKKYINKIFYMSIGDAVNKKTGSLYKDFDRGAGAFFQTSFFFFGSFLKNILAFFIACGILFVFSWKMAIAALIMMPFMALTGWIVAKKTREPQTQNNKLWTKAFGHIGNFFSNMQLGKILRLEGEFRDKFVSEIDNALYLQKFVSRWWSVSDIITSIFVLIARFLVIGLGIYLIMQGELMISGLLLVFSYLDRIYFPISYTFGQLPNMQKWASEVEEFYGTFENTTEEIPEKGKNLQIKNGNIEFKNVNFGYNSDRKIFENLSLNIASGQKVAFVGNTGAGKSTITSLLFRFWEPNSGEIFIDGQDISTLKKSELRSYIGMVSQDNSLFNLTIRENLLFAKPDATDEELNSALKKASADFVFKLKDGLETSIGERGLKLSGGEKQRISIARLFLQNPQILILDEATSALDNKTEIQIQKALDELMKGKTAIIIAHRLSTIKNVDKIFMLENGEIVELGNYDELVLKGGKFSELADPARLVIA